MRIVHLSHDELRAFLGGRRLSSRQAMEHLVLCEKCQTELARTAAESSLVGQMAASPLDPGLADRVIREVAQKSRRKVLAKTIYYSVGVLALAGVVVFMIGPELYSRAVQPVGQMLIEGLSGFAGLLKAGFSSIKSLSAGPAVLALAAVAAVLWFGLLDKLTSRVGFHRNRA